MSIDDAIKNILLTYSKYGVTGRQAREILESGLELGLSLEACYSGLKMQLAKLFNVEELFTLQDVMNITGETQDELLERIEQYRKELEAAGENPDDYFKPIEPQEHIKIFMPKGIKGV